MEANPRSTNNHIAKIRTNLWAAGAVAMLSASLILSACGGGDTATATPAAASTTAAPAATESAETPESDDAATTPEAASTQVIESETGLITETEVLTETEVTTDVNVTQVTTNTVVVTGTVEAGEEDSQVIVESEVVTEAEELEEATATPEAEATVTGTEEMTGTEGTGASNGTTSTGSTGAAATGAAAAASNMGVSGVQNRYVRGSTLLDYNFENQGGEVSGDLEDLLIDLSTARVIFASIEYGGVLDLGDKDIVVPLNAFSTGAEGELVLNIDEATLENYPDVGNNWPDLNDPAWDDDVSGFWTESGIEQGAGFEEATTTVAWLSDLMDDSVADLGAGAGSIVDVLVDLSSSRAPYLIVDYGEGLDTDPYIIPLSAFDTNNREAGLVYGPDFTPDLLENAPRFDQELYPTGSPLDNSFGDQFESAWNDMGFSNDLNNDGQND